MNKVNHPEINVSELTAELRKAMRRGANFDSSINSPEHASENHSTPGMSLSTDEPFPLVGSKTLLSNFEFPQPTFKPGERNEFHVNDLLVFQDAAFVRAAYHAILQREPDSHGYKYYLDHLREGALDRIDILAGLRFSPEGQRQGVRVQGLVVSNLIRRVRSLPIVGYLFGLGLDILRLPVLLRRIRAHQAYSLGRDQIIAAHINLTNESLAGYLANVSTVLSEISRASAAAEVLQEQNQSTQDLLCQQQTHAEQNIAELRQLLEAESDGKKEVRRLVENLFESSDYLGARINEVESATIATQQQTEKVNSRLQHVRAELAGQAKQTAQMLIEARRRLPHAFDEQQLTAIAAQGPRQLDQLYAELEDEFRGSREEITRRLLVYVQRIKSAVSGGTFSIVDLGCGRGEWLELLKDEKLKAVGVDTNRVFLESCRERNLEVVESDALQYLNGLPANSIGAITGFHIIEHLPIDILISLLDEIVRVLRPGGMLIFETPNPENVLVGSNFFYFDPTHRNPIPSSLMKFLLEARGLNQVEIVKLNPWNDARLTGDDELTARINELFYGPMDYAIMGRKVSE